MKIDKLDEIGGRGVENDQFFDDFFLIENDELPRSLSIFINYSNQLVLFRITFPTHPHLGPPIAV
jgi:hypothetical protein